MHQDPPAQATRTRTDAERAGDRSRSQLMQERGVQPGRSAHTTRLNVDNFRQFVAVRLRRDNPGVARIASYLRLGTGTVHSALAGNPINGAFVGALLKKTRAAGVRFEDLVIEDADEQVAA